MKRIVKLMCILIAMLITLTPLQLSQATGSSATGDTTERLANAIVLYVGSQQAFVNNTETRIDAVNPDVKPIIKNSRTLVPVRFVSESLGAKVGWDGKTSTVTLTLGNKAVKLVIGSKKMKVGKSEVTLDTAAEIIGDRTFIPLRSMVEAVGKKVFYDRGLIVISDTEKVFDTVKEKAMVDAVIAKVNSLPVLANLDTLKNLLGQSQTYNNVYTKGAVRNDVLVAEKAASAPQTDSAAAAPPEAKAKATEGSGEGAAADYSTTNTQVQGVDEADIVKTDGEYIYQVNKQRIVIAKAYPAEKMEILKVLDYTDKNFNPQEMYVDGNKLVVIGSTYNNIPIERTDLMETEVKSKMIAKPYYNLSTVKVITYDISDKANIKSEREVELEGNYVSSRKIGSAVYLVNNQYMNYYYLNDASKNITPSYRDTAVKEEFANISYADIRYFPGSTDTNYMIIAGFNLDRPDEPAKVSTYIGASQNIYVSEQNLYVASTSYTQTQVKATTGQTTQSSGSSTSKIAVAPAPAAEPAIAPDTAISVKPSIAPAIDLPAIAPVVYESKTLAYKFSLNDGLATYLCKGEVPGNILNQFSMDENGKYFRIATTVGDMWRTDEYTSRNNVYILDEMMNITGKIENMAPGERIYSVRFMGDRAYVVTFKTVDPLFVLDLKDPYKPAILGALKIPGYSNYIHPYDENHIIGFGKDAVEVSRKDMNGNEIDKMAFYLGMKIAIFDVTDVTNPKEMFTEKIGDRGTDSELLWNHKALLFNKNKNLLAFPVSLYEVKNKVDVVGGDYYVPQYGEFTFQGAYVYNIDLATGFTLRGQITHISKDEYEKAGQYWYDSDKNVNRIMYINDALYTLSNGMIKANAMDDLKEMNSVKIP